MVTRQPDVAKTSLITKVWATFKENEKSLIEDTIVAAYGNKDTDVKGYVNSGLPKEKWWQIFLIFLNNHVIHIFRIYIVNPQGELKNEGTGVVSSYSNQAADINSNFPKLSK